MTDIHHLRVTQRNGEHRLYINHKLAYDGMDCGLFIVRHESGRWFGVDKADGKEFLIFQPDTRTSQLQPLELKFDDD